MEYVRTDEPMLQWHPAFFAGIKIEFCEEENKMYFESEHQLGTKPMQIDVLIIKKNNNEPLEKNIGRIFRIHNIVEYKSPVDYLSIDDFYKVYGYACFYKADVTQVDSVKAKQDGIQQDMREKILSLFLKGLLSMENAAEELNVTVEEFEKMVKEYTD